MSVKYLILTDLDGTLLNSKGELSQATIDYVKKLNKRDDVLFSFSTGRCWQDAEWVYKALELKGFVSCCNSAFIYNPHTKEVRYSYIGTRLAQVLLDFTFLSTLNHGFLLGTTSIRSFDKNTAEVTMQESVLSGENIYGVKLYFVENTTNVDEKLQTIKHLDIIAPSVSVFEYPGLCNIEVQAGYVNKEETVKWFANFYSVQPKNILTFGDNHNDLAIATGISRSYAVKNAIMELKQLTKHISKYTNDENAVIKEIEKFII